jgi:hypothetical protein
MVRTHISTVSERDCLNNGMAYLNTMATYRTYHDLELRGLIPKEPGALSSRPVSRSLSDRAVARLHDACIGSDSSGLPSASNLWPRSHGASAAIGRPQPVCAQLTFPLATYGRQKSRRLRCSAPYFKRWFSYDVVIATTPKPRPRVGETRGQLLCCVRRMGVGIHRSTRLPVAAGRSKADNSVQTNRS